MVQGAENDLIDIRFLKVTTPVIWFRSNEPLEDLNVNILTIDDKAILARTTAQTAQSDLAGHIGQVGLAEHAGATTGLSGFVTAEDKVKINGIQAGAQLNILAPTDAIELVSLKVTTLHEHPVATPTIDGYMTISDKLKLNGIQTGAQVNNITPSQATTLTSGGNADSLHGHGFSVGSETFTAAVHSTTDHTGIPGVAAFPGFTASSFESGPAQIGLGVTVYTRTYGGFSSLEAISAGHRRMLDFGFWGAGEQFRINDVSISGNDGTVVYENATVGLGSGDMLFQCWQVGYGI